MRHELSTARVLTVCLPRHSVCDRALISVRRRRGADPARAQAGDEGPGWRRQLLLPGESPVESLLLRQLTRHPARLSDMLARPRPGRSGRHGAIMCRVGEVCGIRENTVRSAEVQSTAPLNFESRVGRRIVLLMKRLWGC